MATLMEQFKKNVVGSRGDIVDFIDVVSSKGDFARVTNLSVILSSWHNILLTPIRTYNYNPDYGSELYKYAFDPADNITKEAIKNEIRDKLMTYDDRATITSINVDFMSDRHGFSVSIGLVYREEEGRLSVTIDGQRYLDIL